MHNELSFSNVNVQALFRDQLIIILRKNGHQTDGPCERFQEICIAIAERVGPVAEDCREHYNGNPAPFITLIEGYKKRKSEQFKQCMSTGYLEIIMRDHAEGTTFITYAIHVFEMYHFDFIKTPEETLRQLLKDIYTVYATKGRFLDDLIDEVNEVYARSRDPHGVAKDALRKSQAQPKKAHEVVAEALHKYGKDSKHNVHILDA